MPNLNVLRRTARRRPELEECGDLTIATDGSFLLLVALDSLLHLAVGVLLSFLVALVVVVWQVTLVIGDFLFVDVHFLVFEEPRNLQLGLNLLLTVLIQL